MKIPLQSRRGIALIITLIFLSVIVIVAVAFLALTGRERASIADANSLADAQLMAETATERAKAEILASILAVTNAKPFGPGFLVSVSRPDTNANLSDPNVVTNLLIDPRIPVWVDTNRNGTTGPLELRDYVDINRNGRHEGTGEFEPVDDTGNPVSQGTSNFFIGDPEWIGVSRRLTDPPSPHSAANEFIGRYAHVILPAGQMLDLNYIHNYTASNPMTAQVGFARNQGVGSWEINLAEGLRTVNTNVWDPLPPPPVPRSYLDATNLLSYHFNPAATVPTIGQVLGSTVGFGTNGVDDFGDGPVLPIQGPGWLDGDNVVMKRWPGANNTRNFFTFHDFFAPQVAAFSGRLNVASDAMNSYDRYTFFRLLAQFGMDSVPETPYAEPARLIRFLRTRNQEDIPYTSGGRINVNYDNYTINGPPPKLAEWNPADFFMVAADVLLQRQFNFGVTNIPISPTNLYSRSVHRILQTVANIYDATTTNPIPTIFWPVFTDDGVNVYISGYTTNFPADFRLSPPSSPTNGIPPVVGAKKGYPNFNEYSMETAVLVSRKLQLTRPPGTNSIPNLIQQMFFMSLSNRFAVEAWNSYLTPFNRQMRIDVTNHVELTLTNSWGGIWRGVYGLTTPPGGWSSNWVGGWPAYDPNYARKTNSFVVPLLGHTFLLTGSVFRASLNDFEPVGLNLFESGADLSLPSWHLLITNSLTYVFSSGSTVLDYVHLPRLGDTLNLTDQLMKPDTANLSQFNGSDPGQFWRTNLVSSSNHVAGPVPEGIVEQIAFSRRNNGDATLWQRYSGVSPFNSLQSESTAFADFLRGAGSPARLTMQTPYNPARKVVFTWKWEPNDPLVHYTADDLKDRMTNMKPNDILATNAWQNQGLWGLSQRYRPWGGGSRRQPGSVGNAVWNRSIQDPGVYKSDDWNFPTNKLPNIGWLGRVHRGTPWQTIYFKSEAATDDDWEKQSFDPDVGGVNRVTHPTNDWALVDVFTTALHPNATRGRLSINQTDAAAWAALFGGVVVATNDLVVDNAALEFGVGQRNNLLPLNIDPTTSAAKTLLWNVTTLPDGTPITNGIIGVRIRQPLGAFRRLSDILAVPELTVESPYLRRLPSIDDNQPLWHSLDDMAYERIPQQVMSLLKLGEPRFIIYSFGQALKPKSVIRSGTYSLLCTNYQVTGEFSTRAVARVEGTMVSPRIVIESYNILPTE